MTTPVRILGLGTAVPPSIPQSAIARFIRDLCCSTDQQCAFASRIFEHSGVQFRGCALQPEDAPFHPSQTLSPSITDFYPPPTNPADRGPTTAERMRQYARLAPTLATAASAAAIGDAHLSASDITHLLTVSCTGFFAPGLDVALISRLALPPTVHRLHLGFMGCHGAFNALAAARSFALADPAARILISCVELCTLHFAYGWDTNTIIANALFADGAASAIVSASDSAAGLTLADTASLLLPAGRDAMTWNIGDHGFQMTLAPQVPDLIATHLRPWLITWLNRHRLSLPDIRSWAVHPGGPKVLSAVTAALDLPPSCVDISREILSRHGNMSSGTILFILSALRRRNAPAPCVALGFGPGLMAEALLFL